MAEKMSRYQRAKDRFANERGGVDEASGLYLGAITGGIIGVTLLATQPVTSWLAMQGIEMAMAACVLAGAATGAALINVIKMTSYFLSGKTYEEAKAAKEIKALQRTPQHVNDIKKQFRLANEKGRYGTDSNYIFETKPDKKGEQLFVQNTCGHMRDYVVGDFAAASLRMSHKDALAFARQEVKKPCPACQNWEKLTPEQQAHDRSYRP